MSPALSLYLLAAARAEPIMARRASRAVATQADQGKRRPQGEVVWLHLGAGQPAASATTLASRISDERPETDFVLTSDEEPGSLNGPSCLARPADYPRAVDAFLSHWRPDAGIWIGGPIWPVLAAKASRAGIPLVLANATSGLASGHRGLPARDLLGLFDVIVACDRGAGSALSRSSRKQVAVIGPLQRSPRPLEHDEEEYAALSTALRARPVWYAACATDAEFDALRAANAAAQSGSHRLLLIVQPADMDAARRTLASHAALRSAHGVPPPGAALFLADACGEEGLWYRLSSISFVGGTLGGPQAMADPFAPAALGSAVVHGPIVQPHDAQFGALGEAGAARRVADAAELGQAVTDLLAPDRAATLASRAWGVVSDGAEATDDVAEEVGRLIEGRR